MDCRQWETGFDDLLEGRCDAARRAALEAHAAACPRCGSLLALARGDGARLAPPDVPDLAAAVLARTSGPACDRAGGLLAALADGAPELGDAQLLQAHLAGCASCRALAATLAWLSPELRAMAEVEPDARLLADVLAATSARGRPAPAASGARARAALDAGRARAAAWWERQIRRPQFAFEFAYVGTMVLIALFATPISPLRGAPEKALAVVQASPAGLAASTRGLVDILPGETGEAARAAWDVTGGRVERALDGAAAGLAERGRRTASARARLGRDLSATGRALVRFDFVTAATHWRDARRDLQTLWRDWRATKHADTTLHGR